MKAIIETLMKNSLFRGIKEDEIDEIANVIKYSLNKYSKNEIIAQEDDECNFLGLIISGSVVIERLYPSGKEIIMKKLMAGDVFGEALIFSDFNSYPATVMAGEECSILYLTKSEIVKLFSFNSRFMENFMALLSQKVIILNNKIKNLSFKTVKQKVVDYIIQECMANKTNNIEIKSSKEDLALYIGIPRPSLSRELIKLRNDGLIQFDRHNIKVINMAALEEVLFNE